jgi:membrane protease YdiL (CAAX protease family)
VSRFMIWAVLGIMFLYARYAEVQNFFLWEDEGHGFAFTVQWIIVLYLLCFGAQMVAAIPSMLGLHQNLEMLQKMQQALKQNPGLGVFTSATAGITEEFFFRGYVMSRLGQFFKNKHYTVLISALLFSAIHIGYHNLSELIFSFLLGMIFGYYYERYRNITAVVIVHFMVDMVATFVMIHHK